MNTKLFYCYSNRLKKALYNNGFRVVRYGINPKTQSMFWVFIGSEILNYYKDNMYQSERDMY